MFKVPTDPQFSHEVTVMVPVDDGHQEEKLRTRFRVLTDEARAGYDIGTPEGLKGFLRAAVVGFEDVVDDQDKPIPMSDELRERLLGMPYVAGALVNHYFPALYKARLGN